MLCLDTWRIGCPGTGVYRGTAQSGQRHHAQGPPEKHRILDISKIASSPSLQTYCWHFESASFIHNDRRQQIQLIIKSFVFSALYIKLSCNLHWFLINGLEIWFIHFCLYKLYLLVLCVFQHLLMREPIVHM